MRFFIAPFLIMTFGLLVFAYVLCAQENPNTAPGGVNAVREAYTAVLQTSRQGIRLIDRGKPQVTPQSDPRPQCVWRDSTTMYAIKDMMCVLRILNELSAQTGDATLRQYASEVANWGKGLVPTNRLVEGLRDFKSSGQSNPLGTRQTLKSGTASALSQPDIGRSSQSSETEQSHRENKPILQSIRLKLEEICAYTLTRI